MNNLNNNKLTILLTWGTWFLGSFLMEKLILNYNVILLKRSY